MNGRITTDRSDVDLEAVKAYLVQDAVASVSTNERYVLTPETTRYKVALWDFGAKMNIERELVKRGCEVTVLPGSTTAEEILALNPDGIMLSNGPGDPAENVGIIAELRKVSEADIPVFGICLGHQLMALARGGKTIKLKYGHRGANQPVKNLANDRIFVSSQNHGYAVDMNALPQGGVVSYENANDGTCEGIRYLDIPAFTVQFHPEACGGPHDTNFLFDEFTALMDAHKA
jgi:carbamoyl-phosphate synthase small subunit